MQMKLEPDSKSTSRAFCEGKESSESITAASDLFWYPGQEMLEAEIVRAKNCDLFDSTGKHWIDLESGVWCTSLGHGNEEILGAIEKQYRSVGHTGFSWSSKIVRESAREILSVLGMEGGNCVFLCSGSEAVEYGVRLMQGLLRRPLLLTMADSYYGAYGVAKERNSEDWFSFDWMLCRRCASTPFCDDRCAYWASIPFDRVGGFLFEPGSSSGLVRFPPLQLVRSIANRIQSDGGFVMVNEVTTGVGRTGEWFGFEHYDIKPDIVALGKGIGNGYPVSVTAASTRISSLLDDGPIKYAQSHQNDPMGAAVVSEVIRIVRDQRLIKRGREISSILVEGLEGIATRYDLVDEVRARGLMVAIQFHDDADLTTTASIHRELFRRGFLVGRRPSDPVLRLDPAMTINASDIQNFLDAFRDVLESPKERNNKSTTANRCGSPRFTKLVRSRSI